MRYLRPKWPRALIVVVLAIAVTSALDLAEHGVAITGDVPTGLFDVGLPGVGSSELGALVVGALSVIFVGYSETLAAGPPRLAQARLRDRPRPGAHRPGHGQRCRGVGRRLRKRRQPLEDLGRRRRRAAHPDGVPDQCRDGAADDALPRRAVQGPAQGRARSGRDRRDGRADHLGRRTALLPRQPPRLGLLRRRDARHPLRRDHRGDRDRSRALAVDADRTRLGTGRSPRSASVPAPTPTSI